MPVTVDDNVVLNDDGTFTEHFAGDSKELSLERVPDLNTLKTRFTETKAKLDTKLENIIQKPTDKSTDEDRAAYRDTLLSELGAPKTIDDYDLAPAEGVTHDEDLVNHFREFFFKNKIPADIAKSLVDEWDAYMGAVNKASQEAENAAFETAVSEFKSAHPGDKMTIATRIAAKALIQFGPEDLAEDIKKGNLVAESSDLNKWRDINVYPHTLAMWENVGEAMKSDETITNEGLLKSGTGPEKGSAEAVISTTYTHPTSQADRKNRGLNY